MWAVLVAGLILMGRGVDGHPRQAVAFLLQRAIECPLLCMLPSISDAVVEFERCGMLGTTVAEWRGFCLRVWSILLESIDWLAVVT